MFGFDFLNKMECIIQLQSVFTCYFYDKQKCNYSDVLKTGYMKLWRN